MSKQEDKDKWCPECCQFSASKGFTTFRCKSCVKEKGKPSNLPQHLLDHYGIKKHSSKPRKKK